MTEHPEYGIITIRGFYGWGTRVHHEAGEPKPGGFVVEWAASKFGFGEITFYEKDGKLQCHNECMSDEFVTLVMTELVKQAPSAT